MDLLKFQVQNGLQFHDTKLLSRSLTHPSYVNEHPDSTGEDNERLEFLGDAVLDFVSGEYLFHRFPQESEGYLTRLRAALVRTERLARFAVHCGVGEYLRLGKGEEENEGRHREANLCAAFEAVIGALFLDQGIESVHAFIIPFFDEALEEILRLELDKDPKSILQEWSQAHLGITPTYQTIGASGPDHAKEFTVAVILGDKTYAEGLDPSKQAAAQVAAQRALEILRAETQEEDA